MSSGARYRIYRTAIVFSLITATVVSVTIMSFYPREDWWWELSLSNTLTIGLTFPLTSYIGAKLEQIRSLKDKLQTMVDRDRLTKLATRDYFFERFEEVPDKLGTALVVDIDHFKTVNDTYGHLSGDEVIRSVAEILKTSVRPNDIVCRFGGEEFVVFLDGVSDEAGYLISERMRDAVERATFEFGGVQVKVTVSIGVAPKGVMSSIDHAIRDADEALYRAKRAGRNRVVISKDETPELEYAPQAS